MLVGEIYNLNPYFSLEISIKQIAENLSYVIFEARDFSEIDETNETDEISCDSGCILNNKCYSYGYRKNRQYCSEYFNEFVNPKPDNSKCENNFECVSNLCVDGECIEAGFFKKIMNWFSRIF